MRRRAARDAGAGEEPSLTPTALPGVIVVVDVDRMGELVEERGWSRYKPNPVTGKLTLLVEGLARKWHGTVIYGLDPERGTEEALIEIPLVEARELVDDLISIARGIEAEGATVTIVAVTGWVTGKPGRDRSESYSGYRRRAVRVLEGLKRRGGGVVYVDGEVVYSSLTGEGRVRD